MTKALQHALDVARRLSQEEQDELILELLGVNGEVATDEEILTPEVRAELDRRIAHSDAHPDEGVSIEEAVRLVREQLKKDRA